MPRPARFTDDDVLDAALARVAAQRHEVSIADVAEELGGPVGSIYHRFASREVLLIRLWLRSVARFQAKLFDLADDDTSRSAHHVLVEGALHVPRYCREHPDEAVVLTLFRQDILLRTCPDLVRPDVAAVNERLERLTRRLTRQHFGRATTTTLRLTALATRIGPYGLVRPYLGGRVPAVIDDAVRVSAEGILSLPA